MNRIDAYQIEDNHQFKKLEFNRPGRAKKTNVYSKNQALATEIWEYLQPYIPGSSFTFGQLLGMIKYKGSQCVFECYITTKKANSVKNPLAYFQGVFSKIPVPLSKVEVNKTN